MTQTCLVWSGHHKKFYKWHQKGSFESLIKHNQHPVWQENGQHFWQWIYFNDQYIQEINQCLSSGIQDVQFIREFIHQDGLDIEEEIIKSININEVHANNVHTGKYGMKVISKRIQYSIKLVLDICIEYEKQQAEGGISSGRWTGPKTEQDGILRHNLTENISYNNPKNWVLLQDVKKSGIFHKRKGWINRHCHILYKKYKVKGITSR